MKICSHLHWRMKMWRTQISGLLKNEDYQLPHLLNMKIAFLKLLKTEDSKTRLRNVKKMKTMSCAGSPMLVLHGIASQLPWGSLYPYWLVIIDYVPCFFSIALDGVSMLVFSVWLSRAFSLSFIDSLGDGRVSEGVDRSLTWLGLYQCTRNELLCWHYGNRREWGIFCSIVLSRLHIDKYFTSVRWGFLLCHHLWQLSDFDQV